MAARLAEARQSRFHRSSTNAASRPLSSMRKNLIQFLKRKVKRILRGNVSFGDLNRTTPLSRHFGFDRGTPVDRYYIESFLAENAGAIRGRTLEIGDDEYTHRFGGTRAQQRDVL